MTVSRLELERAAEAVAVIAEAFHDYPVMRYVIGAAGKQYEPRLRTLVEFFVRARFWRSEPVLAVTDERDAVVGAALVTLPGERASPPEVAVHREHVWRELGPAARSRYEAYGRAGHGLTIDRQHCHLNMIAVRRAATGRGLARRLLETVHELSRRDPASCGVTLSTEDPRNVPLYEHFGYRLLGQARVAEGLDTWGFFRPDDTSS